MGGREQTGDLPLHRRGILRLIDTEVLEELLIFLSNCGLFLQEDEGFNEEIVEIQAAGRLFGEDIEFGLLRLFIAAPELGEKLDTGVGPERLVGTECGFSLLYPEAAVLDGGDGGKRSLRVVGDI